MSDNRKVKKDLLGEFDNTQSTKPSEQFSDTKSVDSFYLNQLSRGIRPKFHLR